MSELPSVGPDISPGGGTLSIIGRWVFGAIAIAASAAAVGYQMVIRSAQVPKPAPLYEATSLSRTEQTPGPSSNAMVSAAKGSDAASLGSPGGLTWPIWEFRLQDPIPARESPLTPVPWRVLGAALFEGRWHAIVQRSGAQAPEYYKVGDKLPGGYVIQAITQEDMTLRTGRREIVLAYIGSR